MNPATQKTQDRALVASHAQRDDPRGGSFAGQPFQYGDRPAVMQINVQDQYIRLCLFYQFERVATQSGFADALERGAPRQKGAESRAE